MGRRRGLQVGGDPYIVMGSLECPGLIQGLPRVGWPGSDKEDPSDICNGVKPST